MGNLLLRYRDLEEMWLPPLRLASATTQLLQMPCCVSTLLHWLLCLWTH